MSSNWLHLSADWRTELKDAEKVTSTVSALEPFWQPFKRRAARRVATRQMPQAYPPQRGVGKRATKDNARTASLAVVRWDFWRHGLKHPLGKTVVPP